MSHPVEGAWRVEASTIRRRVTLIIQAPGRGMIVIDLTSFQALDMAEALCSSTSDLESALERQASKGVN